MVIVNSTSLFIPLIGHSYLIFLSNSVTFKFEKTLTNLLCLFFMTNSLLHIKVLTKLSHFINQTFGLRRKSILLKFSLNSRNVVKVLFSTSKSCIRCSLLIKIYPQVMKFTNCFYERIAWLLSGYLSWIWQLSATLVNNWIYSSCLYHCQVLDIDPNVFTLSFIIVHLSFSSVESTNNIHVS